MDKVVVEIWEIRKIVAIEVPHRVGMVIITKLVKGVVKNEPLNPEELDQKLHVMGKKELDENKIRVGVVNIDLDLLGKRVHNELEKEVDYTVDNLIENQDVVVVKEVVFQEIREEKTNSRKILKKAKKEKTENVTISVLKVKDHTEIFEIVFIQLVVFLDSIKIYVQVV